jgi:hypothetical protein
MHASFGHVGAVGGEWRTWRGGRLEQLIRLDGGLPPGLVGAPIADAAGRLLGIASHSFSRHHAVVVPVATIERVLDPLLTHGRLPQGYLGIAVQARARDDGRAGVDGLLVTSLAADGRRRAAACWSATSSSRSPVSRRRASMRCAATCRSARRCRPSSCAAGSARSSRSMSSSDPARSAARAVDAMARIVVVGTSPLLADGVAAALRGVDGWDVRIGAVDDGADCWVLPGDRAGRRAGRAARARTSPRTARRAAARGGRRGARRAVGARGAVADRRRSSSR